MILIVDFGSQTTHLIGRRLREFGAEVEIVTPQEISSKLQKLKVSGIILSGSPACVHGDEFLSIPFQVFDQKTPILGLCYGLQLTSYLLGGKVRHSQVREYGPAEIMISGGDLFEGVPARKFQVWMSHGDDVEKLPKGFEVVGKTGKVTAAAIEDKRRRIYGLQFHPEVVHTQFGGKILQNFLKICGVKIKKQVLNKKSTEFLIQNIRESIPEGRAVCALSGGVDSSVAALLVHEAIGDRLTSLYIDSGLMRQDETRGLREVFRQDYKIPVKVVSAKDEFLKALRGIADPEQKRKIIGRTFIKIFEREAKKTKAGFLVQGTIYPDVIESAGTKHSDKIKTHHNVGGLPKKMKLSLLEPLRNFYKDEVRKIGRLLFLPPSIVQRQPFPGPGLAIRIIGEVNARKLDILRRADRIVQDEIKKAGLEDKLWQAFAVYPGIRTTGVRGDERAYGETIGIRALVATDAMSAAWAKLPYSLLDRMSMRICNELREVNRVVYDITNKPPSTMEWE